LCEGVTPSWYAHFDLNRSGAGLAWDFFNPGVPRPDLINRIEDRDLWRFAYPDTRAVQAAVFSYPYDFDTWDLLFKCNLETLRLEGEAIERKHFKDIGELIEVVTRPMTIAGHTVPMANLPYTLTSDAGHKLAAGKPFAGCYWDTPAGRVFSLRSTDEGLDVSAIAKQYGGGGHRNASGFRVAYADLGQFEVTP
jgi:oligoribonuclease NrnB/cAMP/cGMP phosphodiesterase (DHH superfamily)